MKMRRRMPKLAAPAVAVAALLGLCAGPPAAGATSTAVLYKIEFKGSGTVHVTDSDGGGYSLDQQTSWRLEPQATEIWLPRVSAPPGPGAEIKTEATAPEQINPSGEATETGTYPEESGPVSFSCSGPTNNDVSMIDTAEVTAATTVVALTGDFFGTFLSGTDGAFGNHSGEFGDPSAVGSCSTDTSKGYEPQEGTFFYFWNPKEPESEDNQRMEVGALIPPQDVGLPSFGVVADDYSNVHSSGSCEYSAPGSGCTVEFHLKGSWDLTKICEGSVSTGAGTGSGAAGGQVGACGAPPPPTQKKEEKKPKKEKGGDKSKQPKLSLTKVAVKGSGVEAKLKCSAAAKGSCRASLKLTAAKANVGSKATALDAGKSKSVTVDLDGKGKKLLKQAGTLAVRLEISQLGSGKPKAIATRELKIKAGG
jgi:hypothetical protein